jgi:hypothetical protein
VKDLKQTLKNYLIEQGDYAPLLRDVNEDKKLIIQALIEKKQYAEVYNALINDEDAEEMEKNKGVVERNLSRLLKKHKSDTMHMIESAVKGLKKAIQGNVVDLAPHTSAVVQAIENIKMPAQKEIDMTPVVDKLQEILDKPQEDKDYTEYFMRLEAVLDTVRQVQAPDSGVQDAVERLLERLERPINTIPDRAGGGTGNLVRQKTFVEKSDALISAVGQIGGGVTYNLKKYAYNDVADLEYQGKNVLNTALDSDTDWEITKYIYVDGTNTESITKTGSWTGRVALFT